MTTTITAKCLHTKTIQCITHILGCPWICQQQPCECPGKIVCAFCLAPVQELQPGQRSELRKKRDYWTPARAEGLKRAHHKKALECLGDLRHRVKSFMRTGQPLTENQRLMKARCELGLTQQQFADLLGVPLFFISQTVERSDHQANDMNHHRSKANPNRIKARAWLETYEKQQTELAMSQGE